MIEGREIIGVESGKEFFEGSISSMVSENQISIFKTIVTSDMQLQENSHPDVGDLMSR